MLIKLLLVAALISCTQGGSVDQKKSIEALCRNDTSIEITRVSQIQDLVAQLEEEQPFFCPEITVAGIRDLKPLVEPESLKNVCSMEKVEEIRQYHRKYIDWREDGHWIPFPMRKFFLGFGLKVSAACKRRLFDSLLAESDFVPDEDMELIASHTGYDGFITRWLTNSGDYNNLLLAYEMGRLTTMDGQPLRKNLYIRTLISDQIRRLQEACTNSIRPFYEPLMDPLIGLSSIGFNYKHEKELKRLGEKSPELRQWFKTIFLCESLSRVVVFDLPEYEKNGSKKDRKTVRILTEAEANALIRQKLGPAEPVAPIVKYQPREKNEVENQVISHSDEILIKAIDKLAFRKRKYKFLKKVGKVLKDTIIGNKVRLVGNFIRFHKKSIVSPHDMGEEYELRANILAELDNFVQDNDETAFAKRVNMSENKAYMHFIKYEMIALLGLVVIAIVPTL